MGQELGLGLGLDRHAGVFPLSDRPVEIGGIPVNDDGGEQVPTYVLASTVRPTGYTD